MATNKKRLQARAQKLRGWLLLAKDSPLLFEKEVIYDGDWKKLDSDGEGIAFAVRKNILNHWRDSLAELRAAGIKSPLATNHETWDQPENRLGEIVGANVRENDSGLPALFLRILFDDEKSRDIGLKGDVSIGSPGEWYDGTGRRWDWPLQHVASTNAPVIPGLEQWRKIAASFSKSTTKANTMDLDELIKLLGITVPDGASDETKQALIEAKLAQDYGTGDAAGDGGDATPAPQETNMSHEEDEQQKRKAAPAAQPTNGGTNGGGNGPMKKVTVAFAHPTLVNSVVGGRKAQIDALLDKGSITPAHAKELKLSYCDSEAVKLELSHDGDSATDEFERTIQTIKRMATDRPLKASGRSIAGSDDVESAIELSHATGAADRLVKDAERRAKEFAAAQ